jgi:NAD-dependent deacetylase
VRILNWSGGSYSMRRRDALAADPNPGHLALASMERSLNGRFTLCTQNVDNLHERAGSMRVHHMHGSLFESRCTGCEDIFPDTGLYESAAILPKCAKCGAAVRPHIVWFGEMPLGMDSILGELGRATVMLVAGTSGSVYPAAGFVRTVAGLGIRTIYVGPEEPLNADAFDELILGTATEILPGLCG